MESTIRDPQGTGHIWGAELRRALRQGGWRTLYAWSVLVSLAAGGGTLAMINTIAEGSEEPLSAAVTFPVEITAVVAAFVMALGLAMSVARDSQGMLTISLTNVPNRRRLLIAQMGSAFACSALVVVGVALMTSAAALFLAPSQSGAGFAAVGVLSGGLAGGMLGCISYLLGRLVAHPAVAVIVVLGWWLVLPMAIVSLGLLLPSPVQSMLSTVAEGAPSALLVKSATVSTLGSQGPGTLIGGLAGLAFWTVLLGFVVLVASPKREQ